MSKINENFFKNRKYEGKTNYFEKEINKKESNNELIKNTLGHHQVNLQLRRRVHTSGDPGRLRNHAKTIEIK